LQNDNKDSRPAILIVDDELLIRDLLFDFFTSQGYDIHLAENGIKAREMLSLIDFKIALIDLKMPEMDGVELTALLRKQKPQVPVIIMTAYPSMNSAIESIRNGVFDYIVKPFKIADLYEIIKLAEEEYDMRIRSGYVRSR
jgi:DNA-binding NtrC family response regulator